MNFFGNYRVDFPLTYNLIQLEIYIRKLIINITVAYFKLFNYENGQVQGPLILKNL